MGSFIRWLLLSAVAVNAMVRTPASPVRVACAGLDGAWLQGPSALFSHPYGLAADSGWAVSVSGLNYWQIPGLFQGDAALQIPVKGFHAGLGCSVLGLDSLYQENDWRMGAAMARQRLTAGMAVSLLQSRFSADEQDFSFSASGGAHFALRSGLGFFVNAERLFATPLFGSPEVPAPLLSAGVGYIRGGLFKAGIEWEKAPGEPVAIMAGQEVTVARVLRIRCGFRSDPLFFALGIGFFFRGKEADVGMLNHPDLGLLRSLGLVFRSASP